MASGLKVRLEDGSEVGPLEMVMVRSWYEQGLINADSAVQRAGSKSWTKLSQAVDLRAWGNLAVSSSDEPAGVPLDPPGAWTMTDVPLPVVQALLAWSAARRYLAQPRPEGVLGRYLPALVDATGQA